MDFKWFSGKLEGFKEVKKTSGGWGCLGRCKKECCREREKGEQELANDARMIFTS